MKYYFIAFISLAVLTFGCQSKQTKKEPIDKKEYQFYSNGVIKSILQKRNSAYNGKEITYYSNGSIESITNIDNGLRVGSQVTSYSNGVVETYQFYNVKSDLVYEATYDSTGKLIKDTGKIQPIINFDVQKLKNEKKIYITIYLNEPPGVEGFYKLTLINNSNLENVLPLVIRDRQIIVDEDYFETFNKIRFSYTIKNYNTNEQNDKRFDMVFSDLEKADSTLTR